MPKRNQIGSAFRVSDNRMVAFEPLNAILPNYNAPIIRRVSDGEREIVIMNWGFVLPHPARLRGASPTCATTSYAAWRAR
jgi:hypothetical protein